MGVFLGKSLIWMFFFHLRAAFWWGIWKSCADFAAGVGLLPAPDSDIRISLMLINATTQGINSVLGKAVNYPQIKQREKGNQCGRNDNRSLASLSTSFPTPCSGKSSLRNIFWAALRASALVWKEKEFFPALGGSSRCLAKDEWHHLPFIHRENGSRLFPGTFFSSQGGGGI